MIGLEIKAMFTLYKKKVASGQWPVSKLDTFSAS